MVNINGNAVILLSQMHGILDHSQCTQAQKVHFKKPQLLNGRHGKLGGNGAVCRLGKGYKFVNGAAADHHSRRVHGGMSWKALQTL